MALDLTADTVRLTEDLVNIESVSGNEEAIADAVEAALRGLDHLEVQRFGQTVVARTQQGHAERVVIAGHIDTVPVNANLPARRDDSSLHGLGSCDMKGGVAVALRLAATMPVTNRDITYLFYECEEVEAERNGLQLLSETNPDLLHADFAILMEPSDAVVEAGCQGTLRVDVRTRGERAHSARSWTGVNAIHRAADVLVRLNAYQPRRPVIDGLEYHEGLNAVFVSGGVAGNVLPDRVHGLGQLPLRSGPFGRGGVRTHARGVRRLRDRAQRLGSGGDAWALRTRRGCVRRGGRRHREAEVRLDRCGPVQRPRHPGGELRTG